MVAAGRGRPAGASAVYQPLIGRSAPGSGRVRARQYGDSLLLNADVFAFKQPGIVIPFWLMLLWALLAITLNHCLAWTAKPWWRAVLLGAIGGPLSYYAGQRLGAVQFPLGLWPTLAGLSLLWAGLFAVLVAIADRLRPVAQQV